MIKLKSKIAIEQIKSVFRKIKRKFFTESIETTAKRLNHPLINIKHWSYIDIMLYFKDYSWITHCVENCRSYTFVYENGENGEFGEKIKAILYDDFENRKDAFRNDGVMYFLVDHCNNLQFI